MKGRAVGKAGRWGRRAARLLMLLVLAWPAGSASAAPARAKAKPAAASASVAKAAREGAKAKGPRRRKASTASRPVAAAPPAVVPSAAAGPSAEAEPASVELRVREADPKPVAEVVETQELRAGVKTYTFGAQEVEGRLRSPQILYFLRRVRAEFDAELLGHRSFLLELGDTRRHRAFE